MRKGYNVYRRKKPKQLIQDIKATGAVQTKWKNYSKLPELGSNYHHCHLSYSWVAVWREIKDTIVVEVTYAGSRENAPY